MMTLTPPKETRIFNLDLPRRNGRDGWLRKLYHRGRPSLERVLGLDKLNAIYAASADQTTSFDFIDRCLGELRIRPRVSAEDLARIPKSGPLVVVANHPFGAVDGLMLAWVLHQARPDTRVMANFILSRISQLRDMFIFVDPFGGENAKARNLAPLRDSLRWVKNGGCLATFPAGEVAHLNLADRQITDPAWNPMIARIARRTNAAVLPVYFGGHNGSLFQILGLVHPRLRTAMLPRATFDHSGKTVEMRIGTALPGKKMAEFGSDEEAMAYARRRTYLLQHRPTAAQTTKKLGNGSVVPAMQATIVPAVDPTLIELDLNALPSDQLLHTHEDFRVYCAPAARIPNTLREIGRLREITFRATGEGSGRAIDLDRFDNTYLHLFIWHHQARQIVGAYRIGQTDVILPRQGKAGLYTSTLFKYDEEVLRQIGPALELGRSFIRQEYQRAFAPLMLLWKGICRLCCLNPQYKRLFGPVSISNTYQSVSRQLMVQFLKAHHLMREMSERVRPRHPFRETRVSGWDAESVSKMDSGSDGLSELVRELEPDHKGIPVLLKQYLKMGAKLLAFNVDPDFSDVVDGLILVDLTETEPRVLEKYMGKPQYAAFLRRHARG